MVPSKREGGVAMTHEKIGKVLAEHGKWLADEGGSRANLSGANLSRANLSRADLSRANLSEANLSRANLSEANLSRADLSMANLSRANLSMANLSRADLWRADLQKSAYSPAVLLRANWSELPPTLTLELMRHDAEALPDPASMTVWAKGGPCPFAGRERDFYFCEDKKLWKPGKPKLRGWALWEALAAEKKIKITKGDK